MCPVLIRFDEPILSFQHNNTWHKKKNAFCVFNVRVKQQDMQNKRDNYVHAADKFAKLHPRTAVKVRMTVGCILM